MRVAQPKKGIPGVEMSKGFPRGRHDMHMCLCQVLICIFMYGTGCMCIYIFAFHIDSLSDFVEGIYPIHDESCLLATTFATGCSLSGD